MTKTRLEVHFPGRNESYKYVGHFVLKGTQCYELKDGTVSSPAIAVLRLRWPLFSETDLMSLTVQYCSPTVALFEYVNTGVTIGGFDCSSAQTFFFHQFFMAQFHGEKSVEHPMNR